MSAVSLQLLLPEVRERWSALPAAEQIALLQRHRLLPMALYQAQRNGEALSGLASGLWSTLEAAEHRRAQADEALLARALGALKQHGCTALLLKGAALGRWLYPAPELRPCSDIDLLVDPARRLDAHAALVSIGLCSDGYSQFDRASNQASYRDPLTNRQIDLHWALSVVPELACRLSFAEIEAEAMALVTPVGARAPGRVHALIHAVIHFHAHLPKADRPAIWLYDMVLLARGFDARGWAAVDAAVGRAQLAGLHAAALNEAQRWFALDMPAGLLQKWQQLGKHECTSAWAVPDPAPRQRLLRSLTCLPTMQQRLAYLAARLFPSPEWMRGRYAASTGLQLARAYLRRWARGMRQTLSAGGHDA